MGERTGIWLVGARGSIAGVTIAGQAALAQGLADTTGLVTARPEFADVGLAPIDAFVFGGHEVRPGPLLPMADAVLAGCGVPGLAGRVAGAIEAADARIRPGVVRGGGRQIEGLGEERVLAATDAEAAAVVRADLDGFKAAEGLARIVVVNVASTEPPAEPHPGWADVTSLRAAMETETVVLPPSALYAWAAFEGGDAYVNFTPSVGARIPALEQLAIERGAVHAGADGKTGETLMKSVLAELFARRNLSVLSWFGQNILGNEDGRVLDDPENKATKVRSKDHLLAKILGTPPESRVRIDYVRSLGEWKIAWDHIHFGGFLGPPMTLQFTWSGVDSLLAAPLVLDLARLVDLAQRRGERGALAALAPFFKDPVGTDEQRLVRQDELLLEWARCGPTSN